MSVNLVIKSSFYRTNYIIALSVLILLVLSDLRLVVRFEPLLINYCMNERKPHPRLLIYFGFFFCVNAASFITHTY
jgi:hypothetical protein